MRTFALNQEGNDSKYRTNVRAARNDYPHVLFIYRYTILFFIV